MDSDSESFQRQALEVEKPDDNFDPTIEPENGAEFLTRVVYERNNCPSVVFTSNIPEKPKNLIRNCDDYTQALKELLFGDVIVDTSLECLHPTKEWKQFQLNEFNILRQKVVYLRSKLDYFSSTYYNMPSAAINNDWKIFCQNNQPLLSVILRIDQRLLEKLLEFEVMWLKDDCTTNEPPIDLTKNEMWLGSWIYSTLACLHTPLEPDAHSLLRKMARECILLRNKLGPDDVNKAIPLNLFILYISETFRQLDFLEYV